MNRRKSLILAVICLAAGFAWHADQRPMDFRVYHYGARGVFDGTRPVYGLTSGLGWPMHYRYPPLFLLLFAPLAAVPLGPAAAIWVVLKILVLALGLLLLVRKGGPKGSGGPASTKAAWLIPFLFAGPYVIQDFHYGNAQFFIFALTTAALLLARSRPLLAATLLAFGISLKVWPLFFVPYLAARREWRLISWTMLITIVLTLLPAIYFGPGGNLRLLGQWFNQEFATQTGQEEIWFPSQSLRGVLMRYLTAIDYSKVPDSNYRLVNLVSWQPGTVRTIWAAMAVTIYSLFLAAVHRSRRSDGWIEAGLGFCLLSLLQPFTQKYALVVLLWPAIVAGSEKTSGTIRILIYLGIALVLVQPLLPGSAMQRLVQVLGMDFFATLSLTIVMARLTRVRESRPAISNL